jgi:hypothetical protein
MDPKVALPNLKTCDLFIYKGPEANALHIPNVVPLASEPIRTLVMMTIK